MKKIALSKGLYATVDEDDYKMLSKFNWYVKDNGYAFGHTIGSRKWVYMHRVIANTPEGMDTDHINRDKLDNRKSNLRIVTRSYNLMNAPAFPRSKTGIRGVCWSKQSKKWRATISLDKKYKHLGVFDSIEDARKAYLSARLSHYGF